MQSFIFIREIKGSVFVEMDNGEYMEECIKSYEEIISRKKENVLKGLTHSISYGLLKTNYELWLEECLLQRDWQKLNDLIYQEMRHRLLPGCPGGYDHSHKASNALEALACGDYETMERILPHELGATKNGYRFYIVLSNLLMAIWYKDEIALPKARQAAEKFIKMKKPQWERSGVAFILSLLEENTIEMGRYLQDMCKGYMRADYSKAMKRLCVPVHGLYCFAQTLLAPEIFQEIKQPEYKNFSPEYARWRNENPRPQLDLYFEYPEPMEIVNRIHRAPVAKSIISQPYLHSDNPYHSAQLKKTWMLDEEAMLIAFVENI